MIKKDEVINNEELNTYLKYRLNINLVILSFFLFLHCFFGFITYIIFLFLFCLIIFDSLKNSITYMVYYYPFCMIGIHINALLFVLLVATFFIKYIVQTYVIEKLKPNWSLVAIIVLFLIYCFLPFGPYSGNMCSRVVAFLCIFLVLSMAINKTEIIRFRFNVRMLALAIIVASVFSLTVYFSPFLADYLSKQPGRFKALFDEPNILAMFCEMICAILVYYILSGKGSQIEIVLFVVLAVIGFFTMSKAFLILMVIEIIALIFYSFQIDWKKTLTGLGIAALALTILCVIFNQFVQDYFNRFLDGVTKFDSFAEFLNILTTGRYDLWVMYADAMSSNPMLLIFGAGIGAGPIGIDQFGAHNLFISMVYELGIFGSIAFIWVLAYMIMKLCQKTKAKFNPAIVIPILIFALLCCVEDIIFYMNPI